jgi:hypothetical protein
LITLTLSAILEYFSDIKFQIHFNCNLCALPKFQSDLNSSCVSLAPDCFFLSGLWSSLGLWKPPRSSFPRVVLLWSMLEVSEVPFLVSLLLLD